MVVYEEEYMKKLPDEEREIFGLFLSCSRGEMSPVTAFERLRTKVEGEG